MRNGRVVVCLAILVAGCSSKAHVREVTPEAFQTEVIHATVPTVVEFWAHGCVPCMTLSRPLERVAEDYEGRVSFRKLNAGWTAESRRRYNFHGVPTLIFYSGGREVARQVGAPEGDVHKGLVAFVEAGLTASQ